MRGTIDFFQCLVQITDIRFKQVVTAEKHLYKNNFEHDVLLTLHSNMQHYAKKLLLEKRIMEQCHVKGNEKEHTPLSTSEGFAASKTRGWVYTRVILVVSVFWFCAQHHVESVPNTSVSVSHSASPEPRAPFT